MRYVARCESKVPVELGTVHDQGVRQTQLGELGLERLGLGFGCLCVFDDDQAVGLCLGGQNVLQPEGAHLLRQVMAMVANGRYDFNQPNTVWTNDGNGTFTNSGQALGNSDSESVALGDFDAFDQDLVFIGR